MKQPPRYSLLSFYPGKVLKTLLKANSGANFYLGIFQIFLKIFTLEHQRMFVSEDSVIFKLGLVFGKTS